jgi:hypothetical protein
VRASPGWRSSLCASPLSPWGPRPGTRPTLARPSASSWGSRRAAASTYARLLARHLLSTFRKPAVVVENMAGAASLIAANYSYRTARPDGLPSRSTAIRSGVLGRAVWSSTPVRMARAPLREITVCTIARRSHLRRRAGRRRRLPSDSGDGCGRRDARCRQAPPGDPEAADISSADIGARPRSAAIESGEVDGFCSLWDSLKTVWPDGLESGAAVAVIQGGARPLPGLPGVPVAVELARTEEARQLIRAG